MDFEPDFIAEDKYWAFGLFAKKDGTIDWKLLKQSMEDLQYFIAAISLKTADGEYYARLCQSCGYKWIFENTENSSEDVSEYFKDFIEGSVFQQFAEQALKIITRGFDNLAQVVASTPDEFKKNGVDIEKVKDILSVSASILRKTANAFEHPVQKK